MSYTFFRTLTTFSKKGVKGKLGNRYCSNQILYNELLISGKQSCISLSMTKYIKLGCVHPRSYEFELTNWTIL